MLSPDQPKKRFCCPDAVAHVWDDAARAWWRFDDETVTAMPLGPTGEHGDHGLAAERKVG